MKHNIWNHCSFTFTNFFYFYLLVYNLNMLLITSFILTKKYFVKFLQIFLIFQNTDDYLSQIDVTYL